MSLSVRASNCTLLLAFSQDTKGDAAKEASKKYRKDSLVASVGSK